MRLLMISGDRTLAAGKSGAFAVMLEEFARHWERIDILTPRCTAQASTDPSSASPLLPSNVFLHPSTHGLWYQPLWIRKKGRELLGEHRHDVITVHEYPPFYNGIGARLLQRSMRTPCALEIHHIVGWPTAVGIAELIGRWMSRVILPTHARHFEKIRVVNRGVFEMLVAWGIHPASVDIVPSFYLDHALGADAETQRKTYDVTCCGRLVANKGFSEVIEAMTLVPNATLQIIGDGPLRMQLESYVRARGLAERVRFTGWLPDARSVAAAIAAARVFVMPSKSEGGPRVALEAMSYGMPVITTRVGIMPDIIENGINGIFTTGQPSDLAKHLKDLLHHEQRRSAMGKAAKQICHRYEKKASIALYTAFLQGLAVPIDSTDNAAG